MEKQDYNGPRGREEILIYLKNLQATQTGGNNDNQYYYKKYLKYKNKYLELKKNESL